VNTAHYNHAGQFSQINAELDKGLLRHDSGLVKFYESRHCFPFMACQCYVIGWEGHVDILPACMKSLIVHDAPSQLAGTFQLSTQLPVLRIC
jgi:hypothetical protein